jgi:hypothetical protein
MSQAQIETNIVNLNNSMSNIETVVILLAQSMNVDISSVNIHSPRQLLPMTQTQVPQQDNATSSNGEEGCNGS